MDKKADSAIGVIIAVALGLLILVVLSLLVFQSGAKANKGTACNSAGGLCNPECKTGEAVLEADCPANQKCCKIMISTEGLQ